MKQIMIVEPKSISAADKAKMGKAGILVIEHPEPEKVRIVTPMEGTEVNDMCLSALEAIAYHSCDGQAKNFVKLFVQKLNKPYIDNDKKD